MPRPAYWVQLLSDPVYEAIFVGRNFCQSSQRLNKILQFLLPEAMGKLCSSEAMGASDAKKKCTDAEQLQNLGKG